MAFEIVMPRLGWNMEEGAVALWRRHDGERVGAGEIIFEVEGDKAVQEIEALESGILRIPADSPAVGSVVPVGTLLAFILQPGEPVPAAAVRTQVPTPHAPAPVSAAPAGPAAAPAPTAPKAGAPARPPASPRAKRVARELGVDWTRLPGSGRTGRIVERDVRGAGRGSGGAPGSPSVPFLTMTAEADATEIVRLREMILQSGAARVPTYLDMLVKLAACALADHPGLSARAVGSSVDRSAPPCVGIVVECAGGFAAPAIADAATASLGRIAAETAAIFSRAAAGNLEPEASGGVTLAIADVGAFGIDTFTPCFDLSARAVLVAGSISARQVLPLSLGFDSRLAGAAEAARFLRQLRRSVERPFLLLTLA